MELVGFMGDDVAGDERRQGAKTGQILAFEPVLLPICLDSWA
jgi:hypothetical protein